MKLLLKIAYIGTAYCGFQIQNNGQTIQGKLNEALNSVFGEVPKMIGCSRTDSGVHANYFCCDIVLPEASPNIPCDKLPIVINRYLPEDISVFSAEPVPDDFHARHDVMYKEYVYLIHNSGIRLPIYANRAYQYSFPLDVDMMNKAASHIVGEHDFSSFMAEGSPVKSTVRRIDYCRVNRDGDLVKIEVAGNGFLYNMVRIIVGTLIYVSAGKISVDDIPDIIASCDRTRAGFTVPAHGLYLNKVVY